MDVICELFPMLLCVGAAWCAFSFLCGAISLDMFLEDMRAEDERNRDANN